MLGHPFGAREVAFERSPRAVGVAVRVNMQDDPRDIAPVGTVRIGIEQAQVRDEMLLVVGGNRWIGRGQISDIGSSGGFFMGVLATRVRHAAHNLGHGFGSSLIRFSARSPRTHRL